MSVAAPDSSAADSAVADRSDWPAQPVEVKASAPPVDPLAALAKENELLRAVVGIGGHQRLVKALHDIAAGEDGPGCTALLERSPGGASWLERGCGGREMSSAVLRTLPDPMKLSKRAEPLPSPPPSLAGAWAVPLSGGGRTGLWIAPTPPTGGDEGRGRRLWELVGDALWNRFITAEALSAARGALALRDAQVALYAAAAQEGEPQAVLTRLLGALAVACGAERAALYTAGQNGRRIAAAGAELPRPVAAVAAEHEARLAVAVPERLAAGEDENGIVSFDQAALARVGVRSLIGRAAAVSIGGGATGASLLIFKSDAAPLPPHADRTLAWAGGFFADVLPRCTKAAAASRLARRDGLTGLANRRTFDERLTTLFAGAVATQGDLALLMCDLDHFKSVNDTHGHAVGDRVLKEAAAAIQEALVDSRSGDVALAARYGGEELVVLLPDFGAAGAARIAERIREAIARIELPAGGPRTHVTTSLGLALYPYDAQDAESLLQAADKALYAAKSGGRNRIVRAG
ncbi:GGDEF domain-containing protein [Alienimonas californiensis]|uniref:diguanylate cyclase n=1 Tax=Alienimonas californiensis TaxID=2527989 RepID=A0A517PC93_9PLAN|nr:GGDEF domain-containing protein [Alienimonas californiensis]QDT16989.1 putative diguanylate cyclase YcdT [Alienimonas californiensis]